MRRRQTGARPPRFVLMGFVTRALLGRIALCVFVLVSLMEILGLLEQTTPILARHLGLSGVMTFAVLHLPALVLRALPLSVLVGALFLLTQLALGSEIASLRAAGLSTGALYLLMMPAAVVSAGGGVLVHEWVAPRTELALARWWNASDPAPWTDTPGFWFHDRAAIIHVGGFGDSGHTLYNVDIFAREGGGTLKSVEGAAQARFTAHGWRASGLRDLVLARDEVTVDEPADRVIGITGLTPDETLLLAQTYPQLSTTQAEAVLHKGAPASLPKATYRMALFAPYILPLTICVMLLLALPVIYIPPRTGTRSLLPVAALGAGFAFIVLQGILQALGNAGTLPASLAVLAGPMMGILLGLTWLLRMEER